MDETEEERAAREADEAALLEEMAGGDGETVGGGAADRLKKLNAIGQKADKEREDQFADVNDDDTTSKFVAGPLDENGEPIVDAAAVAEAAAAAEEAAAAAARAEAEAAATATPKHKIKVNGAEKEVTLEELVELAQKSESSDATFREAARLRAEAESLAATKPSVKDVSADDSEELLALARALQVGTDEEAVAALRKLKGQSSPPGIKPDEIFQAIDAKLAFNEANRTFETEYADLVKDPRLERMVMDRDNEMVKAGDKRPYLVRYREIGNEVRAWVKSVAGPVAAPPPPADPLKEKADRKAAAPAAPTAASGKAAPTQSDEEPDESVQDVIASMRKARGGPQWARS